MSLSDSLAEHGYALIASQTLENARQVLQQLGSIQEVSDVSVSSTSRKFINSTRAVPFHNEDPDIKWVAWFCEQPACDGGASLLLDGQILFEKLEPSRRCELNSIVCNHRNDSNLPVVTGTGQWYFIPWSFRTMKPAAIVALEETIAASHCYEIHLTKGETLLIDNHRMMHGRTCFLDSSRSLTRFLIK